jgi:hypothetical protein
VREETELFGPPLSVVDRQRATPPSMPASFEMMVTSVSRAKSIFLALPPPMNR